MAARLILLIALASLVLLPSARGADDDPGIPPGVVTTLSRATRDLAKAGHAAEATELFEILTALGLPEKRAATIRKQLAKEKPRTAKPVPRVAKTIRKAAAKLAGLIPEWPEADRKLLAALLVRLDDDCAPAQALLGREKEGGRWLTTEDREGLRRRADLHEHIRKARRQKLEVKRLAGTVPWILAGTGVPGHGVAWKNVELYGTYPPERLERILRVAIQSLVIGNYLVSGKAELPPGGRSFSSRGRVPSGTFSRISEPGPRAPSASAWRRVRSDSASGCGPARSVSTPA